MDYSSLIWKILLVWLRKLYSSITNFFPRCGKHFWWEISQSASHEKRVRRDEEETHRGWIQRLFRCCETDEPYTKTVQFCQKYRTNTQKKERWPLYLTKRDVFGGYIFEIDFFVSLDLM